MLSAPPQQDPRGKEAERSSSRLRLPSRSSNGGRAGLTAALSCRRSASSVSCLPLFQQELLLCRKPSFCRQLNFTVGKTCDLPKAPSGEAGSFAEAAAMAHTWVLRRAKARASPRFVESSDGTQGLRDCAAPCAVTLLGPRPEKEAPLDLAGQPHLGGPRRSDSVCPGTEMLREVKLHRLHSNCPASVGSAPPLEQVWHGKATPPTCWAVAVSATDVLQLLLQPETLLSRVRAETLLRVAREFARLDLTARATTRVQASAEARAASLVPVRVPHQEPRPCSEKPDAKHPFQCGDSGLPPPSVHQPWHTKQRFALSAVTPVFLGGIHSSTHAPACRHNSDEKQALARDRHVADVPSALVGWLRPHQLPASSAHKPSLSTPSLG